MGVGSLVREDDVDALLLAWRAQSALDLPSGVAAWHGGSLDKEIARVVGAALAAHDGNVAATARALGISRTTLYKYLARVA